MRSKAALLLMHTRDTFSRSVPLSLRDTSWPGPANVHSQETRAYPIDQTKCEDVVAFLPTVRALSRPTAPRWGSIRVHPLICTYAAWGVRVAKLAKSR